MRASVYTGVLFYWELAKFFSPCVKLQSEKWFQVPIENEVSMFNIDKHQKRRETPVDTQRHIIRMVDGNDGRLVMNVCFLFMQVVTYTYYMWYWGRARNVMVATTKEEIVSSVNPALFLFWKLSIKEYTFHGSSF